MSNEERRGADARYHGGTVAGMAMTLRTNEELDQALGALAAAEGTSRQEIVRRAVLARYERTVHLAAVRDSSNRMRSQWADVLERLGEV